MTAASIRYCVLAESYAVCRLQPDAAIPNWAGRSQPDQLLSITRAPDELSIVLPDQAVPAGVQAESGFRALKVIGPLPFDLVGLLARLTAALAEAGIPVFVLSTYLTDFILVPGRRLTEAKACLARAGHVEDSERN